jgi:hypothetical protein
MAFPPLEEMFETQPSSPSRGFSPEPEFPDFEPTYPEGSRERWDGDPDEPKTPETAAFELTDSDDEQPVTHKGSGYQREDQAQRWLGQKKWGLVIYRCTYTDDTKWAQFMEVFEAMGRCHTVEDPELDASLAFDVREDRARFQSEDLSMVREHFKSWIHSNEIKTDFREENHEEIDKDADLLHRIHSIQLNKWKPAHLTCPRYSYFIYVDDPAMESVLAHKDNSQWWRGNYCGWVNVVDIDLPVGAVSVRPVTPSHLYPSYYKHISNNEHWEFCPKPPLVDIGDMWGYWPEKGSGRTLANGEKAELWEIQQRLDEINYPESHAED